MNIYSNLLHHRVLLATGAVILAVHPTSWLVGTWTDPAYDSNGLLVAMHQLIVPQARRLNSRSDSDLKEHVTQLGLDFSLVTQWTSFVAASEKVYNPNPEHTPTRPVPLPMAKGVPASAYSNAPPSFTSSGSKGPQFSGNGAPEPTTIFGLLGIGALLAWLVSLSRTLGPRPCQA